MSRGMTAEFIMSFSEPVFQHLHGQRQQHYPCLILNTHLKIKQKTQMCYSQNTASLMTAMSLRAWITCFLIQVAQLFHQLQWLIRVTPQGSLLQQVQNYSASEILQRMRQSAGYLCTTTADFYHQQLASVNFRLLQLPSRETVQHSHHHIISTVASQREGSPSHWYSSVA